MNTLFDKIWDAHVVSLIEDGPTQLYIDRLYCHEVTSPQAFDGLRARGLRCFRPERIYCMPDHNTPTHDQDKPISDYTVYALNDTEVSESGFGQFRSSFILNGVVSLWELSGGKMDKFGVKEFVIAGLLQAGRPFSFYLAKILLALLLGGCSSGINPAIIPIVILGVIALKFPRRR